MLGLRHRVAGRLGALLLASLLLVPLALSGHSHAGDSQAGPSCALCAVAHHAPVTYAPLAPSIALAFAWVAPFVPPTIAPPLHDRSPASGRGPPLTSVAPVA
jgi:hypothetical protein